MLRLQYAPTATKLGANEGAPTPSELLELVCLAYGMSEQEVSQCACLAHLISAYRAAIKHTTRRRVGDARVMLVR